ncbi:alpha/beta-hydrolase family protein [Nocardia sp. CDC159]|uniref:Alpha/beta-hydrolase family protein n=1 Tax=Nocardia pulmonis TaxID=2951408 RepID=A0A9X2E922_9NOCA|nr:alpha/beta-hydrolase family protein [Nocardia pulmonis]MCM6788973.1 alpha/beta-hydrolase family protein [Nocardia sp. CDC159]
MLSTDTDRTETTPEAGRAPRLSPPRIGTTAAVTIGLTAALAPGLLPRTAEAQAVLSGLLVAACLAAAGLARMLVRRWGFDINREWARYRLPAALVGVIVVAGALVHAWLWQNRLRAAMAFAPIGPGYWVRCALVTTVVAGLLIGLGRGVRWVVRRLGAARSAGLAVVAVLATQFALLPAAVDWRRSAYAAANAQLDPTVVRPIAHNRSGSADSVVSWPSLGAEGRKFVAGQPARGVRVYVGMESAPDLDSRVGLAIRELERSGGLQRANLVVVIPTGSGWIDARAAAGLDERFGGDVTLVGLQYSEAPSWATFLFGRTAAEQSARALFTAVEHRLSTMPDRPRLFIYGQSLGATAGSAIFTDDSDQRNRVCAALWAGPPAIRVHHAAATVLANSSDPVVQWSPQLLWHAPDLTHTRPDAPHPQWIPLISFLQTTTDLLSALAPGPGHGHRYGPEQGTAMGTC